ncbi:MAG: hypothetical protein LAQ30_03155 [Acidobacteriia bacterium]|nr:hypothetical protein [Terriglobia bacterium]
MPERISLSLEWPPSEPDNFRSDFFVGAWSPHCDLQVHFRPLPESTVRSVCSPRSFLASEGSSLHDPGRGLVHAAGDPAAPFSAVGFRGYLLNPALHGWCDPAAILAYWANPPASFNGVFTAARILRDNRLELISGSFGIAPLYYRTWNGIVLFATDARLLAAEGDTLDTLAGRAFMQAGYIFGNRTLSSGIQRVPPGHRLLFDASTTPAAFRWFSYGDLPPGDRPIDDDAVQEVEDAFQTAMDRCLRLPVSRRVLTLSSGYDSRRILAALQSRRASFEALTLRTIQKGCRDLDAPWASAMARDFGFAHRVIELADPSQFARDDRLGRHLTDAHVASMEHAWIMPVMRELPHRDALVFDGLGGDIFNNTGYALPRLYACPEAEKLSLIADQHLAPANLDRNLSRAFWPGIRELREYFMNYLAELPEGKNRADLAFLLMRARQGTGVWSQTIVPAGHIPVQPYFDLDYVRVTFQFDPLHKIERFLQDRCLARFWPQYYAYPGSRRIPPQSKPGNPARLRRMRIACLRQLYAEAGTGPWYGALRPWLSPRGYAILLAAANSDALAEKVNWWMYPLLSIGAHERSRTPCWRARPD